MSVLETIKDRLKLIGSEVQKNPRINPDNPDESGWGQFVNAPTYYTQIGPYGTCAALLLLSLTHPSTPPPDKVKTQLNSFWNEPEATNKLLTQTVRLAFLVLSFSKSTDPFLGALCNKAAALLKSRQLPDGGWGDALPKESIDPVSKIDVTAWAVLALFRHDPGDDAVKQGAEFIQSQLTEEDRSTNVPAIAVAAALIAIPKKARSKKLRRQAAAVLRTSTVNFEEHISFFDYPETDDGKLRMSRDYLCFPAFFANSHIIAGLSKTFNPLTFIRIGLHRLKFVEGLLEVVPTLGAPYKLPGAPYAATVDQGMIALTYEALQNTASPFDPALRIFRPIFSWFNRSWLFRFFGPLLLVATAIAIATDIHAIPNVLREIFGIESPTLMTFVNDNEMTIRVSAALFLALVPSLPGSVLIFLREKFGL
ncbi:hypothetical protein G6L37_09390 [Agrobacterium rubi]|uniref:hypothetical protein n=1 Tax=Agrobacterium rubi TaxID=28099 RepID=UPI00157169C7|nr:hypothetical protein [Agrobacterium rubi]NTF06375.1 hypothetical protein [Agrobacterium rubi]NTF18616.1 hypothetical protein [Agrobacterium rubi]NTF25580.1 hypothetical protein [Agrobacterium rubi]